MKITIPVLCALFAASLLPATGQPSFEGPMPDRHVVTDANVRRQDYNRRADEVVNWYAAQAKPGQDLGVGQILAKLVRHEDEPQVSQSVIALMKDPGTGPFWMFPVVGISMLGQDQLSPAAKKAIRDMWRTTYQVRGDTENHWLMYYTSLYLIAEQNPNEPANTWYTGKSSAENLAEARSYLISWMDLTTTVGQGEFTPTGYIAEYSIPLLYLATWAKDPAMRQRGQMMLDWLYAELAENTLNGVLHGPNSRTDEREVVERGNTAASFYCWLLFGNTVPPQAYGGFGIYFAVAAKNYHVPDVIYHIAVERDRDYTQHDLKRTRRRWRYSDQLSPPVYRTNYTRKDYAVGSIQGGLIDPIQTHVWDVTWDVPDPRGVHNTIFSLQPYSANRSMQMYFSAYPELMIPNLAVEGKPSYDLSTKVIGSSPYEQVFQDHDTVIALYNIAPGTRFPQVNGFFSKDLQNVTEDKSGWIFAQGGKTYLAYRPLAGYHWEKYQHRDGGWAKEVKDLGDKLLISPHLQNGTIVQAADESEFKTLAEFAAAIRALPLEFKLAPEPTVKFTTLRGHQMAFTYGQTPVLDGKPVDYADWKLFQSPYLNAEKGSKRLTITHGELERVLDFNTLTITDRVREP
ncbi:hypothetical protein K0B96_01205 [Horticoccus luteus]|uniref:Heparin-sulfate lyase N-terminal domain-containing protein n=1 Tax=Horticoccus luteus TaxID=2862869 RepID=A0A8F9TWT0_9BACT|nr:hypothetical protein [Horticoccus luteus]QYM79264.1 hypothetical protein K0B96_01205 [Horticoccus luteus]